MTTAVKLKLKGYVAVPFSISGDVLKLFGYKCIRLDYPNSFHQTSWWTTKAGESFLELIHDIAVVLWGANTYWVPSENAYSSTVGDYMLRTAHDLHALPSDRRKEFLRTFESMSSLGADNNTLLDFISETLP